VTEQPPLNCKSLTKGQSRSLEHGLNFAAELAGGERPLSARQIQKLYDSFIEEGITDSDAIISLGLAFGENIAQTGGFEWVRIEDEYGEETSLRLIGKTVYCHPISMIQKRLEHRDQADIGQLTEDTISYVLEMSERFDREASESRSNDGQDD
jgi:hypothetical protein